MIVDANTNAVVAWGLPSCTRQRLSQPSSWSGWPAAPSIATADDDSLDRLVAAVYHVLADARTALSWMRGDRRTR
jgi:hypothetical protein